MTRVTRVPWLDDGDARLYVGDVRDVLEDIDAASVHTRVSSPPYWGLRDYGVDGQIGLEASPDAYVAELVEVYRAVRRVLRPDGTVWLNLGDSYASSPPGTESVGRTSGLHGVNGASGKYRDTLARGQGTKRSTIVGGLKPKDLVGIPWRVAFALQADGWWLRSAIVWHKPNPMPESVTDRPTSSYEMVFLLSPSERYFYDADAIREEDAGLPAGNRNGFVGRQGGAAFHVSSGGAGTDEPWQPGGGRNARNVWTIATQPYPGAHFATFPDELPRRCIAAGTSEAGACAACGAPHERVASSSVDEPARRRPLVPSVTEAGDGRNGRDSATFGHPVTRTTTGWRASCACDADVRPCVVLDPFAGSGTTLEVARSLGRHSVGVELNPEYAELASRRLAQGSLLV